MLYIIGYTFSLLIGFALGLLGGGGAIIAVPIMHYLMGIDPLLATAYSLFVVGATSLVGAIEFLWQNKEKTKFILSTAFTFAPVSMLVGQFTRKYLVKKWLPEVFFEVGGVAFTKGHFIMLFFACLMVIVAFNMIKSSNTQTLTGGSEENVLETRSSAFYFRILIRGVLVGIVGGIAGAGAGFLIVPVLTKSFKIPIKLATGISLFIICANSWFTFGGEIKDSALDWQFLLLFTSISIVGIFIGTYFKKRISAEKLKPIFGYFVLIMGIFILLAEPIGEWLKTRG
jgi:uncharacterized membrane protein YfcA